MAERRGTVRVSYIHPLMYSYPLLNSRAHMKAHQISSALGRLIPFLDYLRTKLITSRALNRFISPKKHWGLSENMTAGGICLNLTHCFDVGQELLIFDDRFSHKPFAARAAWCSKTASNIFKVGFRFSRHN